MKKKMTSRSTPPNSGLDTYTVGSRLTEYNMIRITPFSDTNPIIEEISRRDFTFSGNIALFEKWAIQVLQDARLPSDPNLFYRIPEGVPVPHTDGVILVGTGTLQALVAARGYRERDNKEWYAAEILSRALRLRIILSRIKEGTEDARNEVDALAFFSCDFGLLAYEAIGFKFRYESDAIVGRAVLDGGHKGGETKKRLPPVADLVRSLIRKNRGGTAAELWEMIPKDQINGIKISEHKFYRNAGRILALRKVDGCKDWRPVGKTLKLSAFKKRVGKERNPPAR